MDSVYMWCEIIMWIALLVFLLNQRVVAHGMIHFQAQTYLIRNSTRNSIVVIMENV